MSGWAVRRNFGRDLTEHAAFWFVLAIVAIVFLAWSLPATILRWTLPSRHAADAGEFVIMGGFRGLLALMRLTGIARTDLTALDALRDDGGIVIVSNHPSLLDAVLVISRLPRVVCITKAENWDNPFLGAGARLAGYIRNDAGHVLIRRAAASLRDGRQLLIFPEGTRTARSPVGTVKGGFALMARAAGVPVQTVLIEVDSPFLGKSWPFFRKPAFPVTYRARLGRRFVAGGSAVAFAAELEAYFRAELARPPTAL